MPKVLKTEADIDIVYANVYYMKKSGGFMSETTNTRNFRENLKHYFELAKENPIAINRGNERYVLLSESEFVKMKEEVMNLQKSLISTLQTLNEGGATEYTDVDGHHKELLDEVLSEESENKKQRKVAW